MSERSSTSSRGGRSLAVVAIAVAGPVTCTLWGVGETRPAVENYMVATPYGYATSLSLFLVPLSVLLLWYVRASLDRAVRRAVPLTLAILVPSGVVLDVFFAARFFEFRNVPATWRLTIPVVGGAVPMEEFVFYASGFAATLLTYVWCDSCWLAAYTSPADRSGDGFLRALDWRAVPAGQLLVGLAFLYKRHLSGTDGGFPWYFAYLVAAAVVPTFVLLRAVRPYLNWRALGFTLALLVLVSLLWEATLGVPYRWWGYRPEAMIGVFIPAWAGLPIEEPLVWTITSLTTAVVYESVRVGISRWEVSR